MTARRVAAGIVALATLALLAAFHDRLAADFIPPDRSYVGPNLVAAVVQAIVVLIAVVLLWPPIARAAHRFADAKLAPLHARHEQHAHELAQIRASIAELRKTIPNKEHPHQ